MAGRGSSTGDRRAGKEPATEETLQERIGRLKLTEAESKKLVLDDREEGSQPSWALAGKVLSRKVFHIQTIAEILRPACGNPRGLLFRDGGENMFVATLATERDRERIWERSPWTVSKHAVVLENFVDCQRPAEIRFDKLLIMNLPFNMLNSTWGEKIAGWISDDVVRVDVNKQGLTSGGFLRARVWIKVDQPLRRCIAIDSSRRESCDWYELEYEELPYFCFACGLLGHSDLLCPDPGERDEFGRWPYGPYLRAQDDRKHKKQQARPSTEFRGTRDNRTEGDNAARGEQIPPFPRNAGRGRGDGRGGGRTRVERHNTQAYRRLDMANDNVNGAAMDHDGTMVVFDPNKAGEKRGSTEDPRVRAEAPSPEAKKHRAVTEETENQATAAGQLRQS
jgi:hypothetical protein